LPIRSIPREGTPSLTLDRPYNHSSSSSLTARSRTTALPSRRLNTLALNPDYARDTYFNYSKVGYYLSNYTLPYAPRTELKELIELPKSLDSKSKDEY